MGVVVIVVRCRRATKKPSVKEPVSASKPSQTKAGSSKVCRNKRCKSNAICKRFSQRGGKGVRQRAFDPNCNYCVLYEFMNGKCEAHGSRSPSRESSETRDIPEPLHQPFLDEPPDQAIVQEVLGDPDTIHEHMEQINEQTRQVDHVPDPGLDLALGR
uniref:Uncharacterized protein n=1 Tax=Ditylenchus dipsaci TaxID=166011 RepID=A0A915CS55_9BILA